jgi:hypothetical protein
MEKTFANATLLSASVLAVFMVMIPINHLSAQNDVKLDEKAKVRKATIVDINLENSTLTVDIEGMKVPVVVNASTTVFLGNGDEVTLGSVKSGSNVYIFGEYDVVSYTITATKIVIRNTSPMRRTTLSRAQMKSADRIIVRNPTLDALGLSAK